MEEKVIIILSVTAREKLNQLMRKIPSGNMDEAVDLVNVKMEIDRNTMPFQQFINQFTNPQPDEKPKKLAPSDEPTPKEGGKNEHKG